MSVMDIDAISMFKGDNLYISKNVYIKHPKLIDIVGMGENRYSELLSAICSTSLDIADILWFDMNIWYEDIKDEWEFFIQKCISSDKKINVKIKYENFDIPVLQEDCLTVSDVYRDALNFFFEQSGEYIIAEKKDNGVPQKIIYNVKPFYKDDKILYYEYEESNFKFTKFVYEVSTNFLKNMNGIKNEYKFLNCGTKSTQRRILKYEIYNKRKKKQKSSITLESICSSLIAKGAVSYKDIWDLPIYTFYSIYYRLVKIDNYNNTMTALYSGCLDTNKNPIDFEKINWSSVIN